MKNVSVVAFAVATVLCVTPLSLRCSHSNVAAVLNSAQAAELNVPVRHYRTAVRYGHSAYYGRLYDRWCGGPYTGGGWNGGTYYGGPWIDLRCYGAVD